MFFRASLVKNRSSNHSRKYNLKSNFMTVKIIRNIKSIRELKNYTQEYMADKLGMTQAGYSKIEKGINKLSIEKLDEIATVLEVTVENIINFEKEWYFKNNRNETPVIKNVENVSLCNLLREKIELLEKLLNKTDSELRSYREKFGIL